MRLRIVIGAALILISYRSLEARASELPRNPAAINYPTVALGWGYQIPGQRVVHVPVTLSEPAHQTIALRWATDSYTAGFFVAASGTVVFHPGEQVKLIAISLLKDLAGTAVVRVGLGYPQNSPQPTKITNASGGVRAAKARPSDEPVSQPTHKPLPLRPSGLALVFDDNFRAFTANDTGHAGQAPVWMSRLSHGREQPGNKELGYYADPEINPGTSPWGRDAGGRFFLQAERHPQGIKDRHGRILQHNYDGGEPEPYTFSSSVISTRRLFNRVAVGSYVEARFQIDAVPGSWPAFWLLPNDGSWPALELDVLEAFFMAGGKPSLDHLKTTVHWKSAAGKHEMYGLALRLIQETIPDFDPFATHTWGVHWGSDAITFYVDDKAFMQIPNVLPSKDCYILLNVAVGGLVGVPSAEAPFPARMHIDWLRVYQPSETTNIGGGQSGGG